MSEFPHWLRLAHFFDFLFVTLLIRSGIEIIGSHPKFYWNDDALPGSKWFRLGDKRTPEDEIVPLPVAHGTPLRLRIESHLGYKMAKWVCGIEFVDDDHIGQGEGGWRDDVLDYYLSDAGI